MKKKIGAILLSSISVFFSLSCSENSDDRVTLYKMDDLDSTVLIETRSEFENITRNDSCMIYVSLEGCHYCADSKKIIKEYVKKNNTVIYEVDQVVYKDAYSELTNEYGQYANLYPILPGFPSFLFFSGGKLKNTYFNSITDMDTMEKVMDKYTNPINIYYLNDVVYTSKWDAYCYTNSEQNEKTENLDLLGFTTERLDSYISSTSFTVAYSWRKCSDCINYHSKVLYPYLRKNKTKKIYLYEVDGFMTLKRMDDNEYKKLGLTMWSEFCTNYHLSDYGYTDSEGNIAGYTPTIVTYKGNKDNYELSVFSNQTDLNRNDDGTLSYKKAFYSELTEIKSDTKVSADSDELSSDHQKAVKELNEKVQKKDIELNTMYLRNHL